MNAKNKTSPLEAKRKTHILVIDDDPTFRALMTRAAKSRNISVTVAGSLGEVEPMEVPKLYDVVILDYYLDNIQENLTGSDVAFAMESTPILLTSSSDHAVSENVVWPTSIRKFVNKKIGVEAILAEAEKLSVGV